MGVSKTSLILCEVFARQALPGARVQAREVGTVVVTGPLIQGIRELVDYHQDPETKRARAIADLLKANPDAFIDVRKRDTTTGKSEVIEQIEPSEDAPCPFCGGKSITLSADVSGLYYNECDNCAATGPKRKRAAQADAVWRKRNKRNA